MTGVSLSDQISGCGSVGEEKKRTDRAGASGFQGISDPFLRRVFYNQAVAALREVPEVSDSEREQMAQLYSLLKYHYYQERRIRYRIRFE